MLIVPNATATVPAIFTTVSAPSAPSTMMPPSSTMPWIALVPDISGVCSIVGTFEITSKPTNTASTKIVISVIRSPLMTALPSLPLRVR